jgi:hypothetical protein
MPATETAGTGSRIRPAGQARSATARSGLALATGDEGGGRAGDDRAGCVAPGALMATADRPVLSLAQLAQHDRHPRKQGRQRRFLCPLEACADHQRRFDDRLVVDTETGLWLCHRCQASGQLREFWAKGEDGASCGGRRRHRASSAARAPTPSGTNCSGRPAACTSARHRCATRRPRPTWSDARSGCRSPSARPCATCCSSTASSKATSGGPSPTAIACCSRSSTRRGRWSASNCGRST